MAQSRFIIRPRPSDRLDAYSPYDYGAKGDGASDDAAAINRMFADASGETDCAIVDMRGRWAVSEPVYMELPKWSTLYAGRIQLLEGSDACDRIVNINFGAGTRTHGIVYALGNNNSAIIGSRIAENAVNIEQANRCVFDGFTVKWVKRSGVTNYLEVGNNVIGAQLGTITATYCGSQGPSASTSHTKRTATATNITREGTANPSQLANLALDPSALDVEVGDYVSVGGRVDAGGHVCRVDEIGADYIKVYPWPGTLVGAGSYAVESMAGAGLDLRYGNTTTAGVASVYAQYCGIGVRSRGLYGGTFNNVMSEICGIGMAIGDVDASVQRTLIVSPHLEGTNVDVVAGSLVMTRSVIVTPARDIVEGDTRYHIRPTLNTGLPNTSYVWPFTIIPDDI